MSDPGERCTYTFTGATGIEWECVLARHDEADPEQEEPITHPVFGERVVPPWERHYLVPRWPNRPTSPDA